MVRQTLRTYDQIALVPAQANTVAGGRLELHVVEAVVEVQLAAVELGCSMIATVCVTEEFTKNVK
jgi:hypothetical protein